MPMRFGRAIGLALAGGAATFVCWYLLFFLIWMPFWHQLPRYGMYVHDVEATYLVTFRPVTRAQQSSG